MLRQTVATFKVFHQIQKIYGYSNAESKNARRTRPARSNSMNPRYCPTPNSRLLDKNSFNATSSNSGLAILQETKVLWRYSQSKCEPCFAFLSFENLYEKPLSELHLPINWSSRLSKCIKICPENTS